MGSDGDGASFVGGRYQAEEELAAGVIERRESDFVEDEEVVPAEYFDGFPDGVIGGCPVEVFDKVDGGEVADFVAGCHCGVSEGDQVMRFPGAGGADEAQVRCLPDPVERDQIVVGGGCGIDDSSMLNSASVLRTGNFAAVMRFVVFDLSLATISASISVRRNSSGDQRCVFGVMSTSGEIRRMVDSLSVSARRRSQHQELVASRWLVWPQSSCEVLDPIRVE